jgi:hypothetical protein
MGEGLVLGLAQENIPAHRPFDARFEAALAIQPDQIAAIARAALDQEGGKRHLPQHDDAGQAEQRDAQPGFVLNYHAYGILVEVQHGALRLHIQHI